jgi:Protein of unknown function (DUF1579)
MSSNDVPQQAPSGTRLAQLDELDALIGVWRTEGRVLSVDGDSAGEIIGTDAYEWLDGRFFVVHRVDVHVAGAPVKAIEIIGFDSRLAKFTARSYDNTGAETAMTASVSAEGVWTFEGGGEVAESATPSGEAGSAAVRSTLTVAKDGRSMHAHWERSTDGRTWVSWMRVDFVR